MQVAGKDLNRIRLVCKAESDLEMKRKWIFENLLQENENRWIAAKHWIPKLNSLDTFLNIILSIDMLKSVVKI